MTKPRITTATLLLLVGAFIASVPLMQAAPKRTGVDAENACLDAYNRCYAGCEGKTDSCYSACESVYQQCSRDAGVVFVKFKKRPQATLPTNPVLDKGPTPSTKGPVQTIDLRQQMKQMKLKDGKNMVYQGPSYKLIAVAKGGKVTRWLATDSNGRPLPTTLAQGVIECQVCVIIKTGTGEAKTCTVVDCSILEKAKTAEKAQ